MRPSDQIDITEDVTPTIYRDLNFVESCSVLYITEGRGERLGPTTFGEPQPSVLEKSQLIG